MLCLIKLLPAWVPLSLNVPVHAMKAYRKSRGVPPIFLTSALDGGEWSCSIPGRSRPGKESWYPLNRRLCGPQMWFGQCVWGEKNLSPAKISTSILQPVV